MTEPTKVSPSAEGKRRYPPDGIYDGEFPCTCTPDCPISCKGEKCGCEACHAGYQDFLSLPDV